MTPLERTSWRVVRLLPPEERAARGEEVLGVLLDLSAGRQRPPVGEVLAVGALALRLRWNARARRLRGALPVLAAAMVIITATPAVGFLALLTRIEGTAFRAQASVAAALWLAAAVGWLLGHRRALYLWWPLIAFDLFVHVANAVRYHPPGDAWSLFAGLPELTAAAVLFVAVRRRTPAPRPRAGWLLVYAAAIGVWVTQADEYVYTGSAKVGFEVAGSVVALLVTLLALTGRRRFAAVVPTVVVLPLYALGLLPMFLLLAVLVVAAGVMITRRVHEEAVVPSTSLAT